MSQLATDELLAIALYESWARSVYGPRSAQEKAYSNLTPQVRNVWRANARQMMQEARVQV